jgi:NAD(P)-dependent dehydrogenase (short-subunit alcohol dehydrogenase family)
MVRFARNSSRELASCLMPAAVLSKVRATLTAVLARSAGVPAVRASVTILANRGLHDALAAGAGERGEARIVSLTSGAHMRSPVVFGDIQFERREYDPQAAYAQSKTADSLFAVEATRRWASDGIVANAVNPGGVATGLQRHFTQKQKDYLAEAEAAGAFAWKSAQQGAATTLVAAVAPEFAHTGGHYLDDCRAARTVPNDADLFQNSHGVKRWAIDPDTAQELWTVSLSLISQP